MRQLPKTELSPQNGCVIDMKWKLGPLSYFPSAAGKVKVEPSKDVVRLPELVIYDQIRTPVVSDRGTKYHHSTK